MTPKTPRPDLDRIHQLAEETLSTNLASRGASAHELAHLAIGLALWVAERHPASKAKARRLEPSLSSTVAAPSKADASEEEDDQA